MGVPYKRHQTSVSACSMVGMQWINLDEKYSLQNWIDKSVPAGICVRACCRLESDHTGVLWEKRHDGTLVCQIAPLEFFPDGDLPAVKVCMFGAQLPNAVELQKSLQDKTGIKLQCK